MSGCEAEGNTTPHTTLYVPKQQELLHTLRLPDRRCNWWKQSPLDFTIWWPKSY